tara:strand:+ start:3298 stop:3555 length:258 start_codon:yes stop_codon:yes gene_type:complete
MKNGTLECWKRMWSKEKDDPTSPSRYFTIKRNEEGELIEIYYIYKLDDHIKDEILTFEEVIEVMKKEKLKKLKYIGPKEKTYVPV